MFLVIVSTTYTFCRYLIKNDMMFVVERDVETHIWKTVYYQVIEMLKSSFLDTENTSPENRKKLKSCLLNLFDEGVDYYTQLLTDLSSTYRFVNSFSLFGSVRSSMSYYLRSFGPNLFRAFNLHLSSF